jgi:hypothetical protein
LKDYVHAAFSGIWVQTQEPDEAHKEIAQLCESEEWQLVTWDCAKGLWTSGGGKAEPLVPLAVTPATAASDITHITVLWNYHRFLSNPMVVQALANAITEGKADRNFFIVLSPVVQIPVEVEKLFVVIEHQLPTPIEIAGIAASLLKEKDEEEAVTQARAAAMENHPATHAAAGLTRYEGEGAFALARHGEITPDTVWELKASMLKKSGLLEMHRGQEKFADLGGLDALKSFTTRALGQGRNGRPPQGHSGPKPRGVLLLGVFGTGKSAFARALGNEVARPTLTLDVGALYGSLVGQTEERVRLALKIADAMAPCILICDEIEKALSGVGSNGDSGVSTRLFGTLLTWLNDHTSDVFVVATSNDVSKLPPEFSRAERWDGIFFIDMPVGDEKAAIWQMYRQKYNLGTGRPMDIDDADWTGAEIKSCCRLAALLGVALTEAAQHIVPVAVTAADKVSALREWASGRCLNAATPGIFASKPQTLNHQPRRRNIHSQRPTEN